MERYDQQDKVSSRSEDYSPTRNEHVVIDQEHMAKIVNLFLINISDIKLKNSDIKIIKSYNNATIIFNHEVSLEQLSNTLGKKLNSKLEFVKEYYLYKLDEFTNLAYDRKVTAIQEYPYSFIASDRNPDIIVYEFIN